MEPAVGERIIVLVDMDCFYVQVEQKLCPGHDNKPCAVVQYNTWQGGGIIAVNYEARACGVKRGMRGDEAKKLCPDIHNFRVPEVRGKADLTRYREAGAAVIEVLCEFCDSVERASIDEAYLDVTSVISEKMKNCDLAVCSSQIPNTFVVGWDKEREGDDVQSWLASIQEEHMLNDQKLARAAVMVEEMRTAVFNRTKFRCSAGIAHNKMLAKLACGLHKPNKQTILPHSSVPILYRTLPIHKVRNLGGKLGDEVKNKLNVTTMGDLMKFTRLQLCNNFGEKTGSWLYSISRGVEHESVTARQLPKSIGCGKNFPGKNMLDTKAKLAHWMSQLAAELEERLKKDQVDNRRFAKSLTVSVRSKDDHQNFITLSRTCSIHIYNAQKLADDALHVLQKLNTAASSSLLWKPPILSLALSASKFEDKLDLSSCSIDSYFIVTESCDKVSNFLTSEVCDNQLNSITESEQVKKTKTSHFRSETQSVRTINSYFNKCVTKRIEKSGEKHIEEQNTAEITASSETGIKAGFENFRNMPFDTKIDENTEHCKGFFAKKFEERTPICLNSAVEMSREAVESEKTANTLNVVVNNEVESSAFSASSELNKNSVVITNNKGKKMDIRSLFGQKSVSLQSNFSSLFNAREVENPHPCLNFLTVDSSKISCDQQTESQLPPELVTLCALCKQNVPVWQEQEHSDFHVALNLQNEIEFSSSSSSEKAVSNLRCEARNMACFKETSKKNKLLKRKVNTLDAFMK